MPDATNRLIADLDDPAKFERVPSVPVFVAHEREFPELRDASGRVVQPKRVVRVTDDDLRSIAERLNREIRATGHLRPLTVGHRKFAPDFPEQHQPPLVGFAKAEYRVERVQRDGHSFLAVVEDEYVMRDQAAVLRRYPYRSIDYDPDMKLSEGTALLLRPPFLKMGTTLIYQYDGATTVPDMPNPAPAAPADGDDFSPAETAAYERCMRYMAKKHPKLRQYMEEAAGPANAAPPEKTYAVGDGSQNQRGQEQAMNIKDPYQANPLVTPVSGGQFATYAAELASVKAQLAAEQTARKTAECRAMLDPLVPHRRFDYGRELATLLAYADDATRAAHVKYIADNYLPLVTSGGMVSVYSGTAHLPQRDSNVPEAAKAPERHDETMEYMYSEIRSGRPCSYEDAKAAVLRKYVK